MKDKIKKFSEEIKDITFKELNSEEVILGLSELRALIEDVFSLIRPSKIPFRLNDE